MTFLLLSTNCGAVRQNVTRPIELTVASTDALVLRVLCALLFFLERPGLIQELTASIMKMSLPCECELGVLRRRFSRLFGLVSRGRQRPCFCSVLGDLVAIGLLPAAPAVSAALRDVWESLRFAAPAGAGSI
jgi:hypothetical protein